MKKTKFLLLVLIIALLLNIPVAAEESILLSDMSDEQCIAFLANNGIEIPTAYDESMSWMPFIRTIIEKVEENPNVQFAFGYFPALDLAYQIKDAVNTYYNRSTTYTVRSSNILQDNIVYGTWRAEYVNYNCYAYAINYYECGRYTAPGMIEWVNNGNAQAEHSYNWLANAYTVANWVKDDLESLGYTDISISSELPTMEVTDHTHLICVRIDTDGDQVYGYRDYHFMKLCEDGNWYQKPGPTNPLQYLYTPENSRIWVSEGYDGIENRYFRNENFTYDSEIYFIRYTTPHTYVYRQCGVGQHVRTCTVCGETAGAIGSCLFVNDVCRICGGRRITEGTITAIIPPKEVA